MKIPTPQQNSTEHIKSASVCGFGNCQTYGNLRCVYFGNPFPNTVAIRDENKLNDKTPSNLGHRGKSDLPTRGVTICYTP